MAINGSHNLQVLRGLSSNRSLLSCNGDGTVVDLWSTDDGSGRQVWKFELVSGYTDLYNIIVSKGVSGDRKYLSCTSDGAKVDLWSKDDNSGRQRWRLVAVQGSICNYYNVIVSSGVDNGRVYLSCTEDGTRVDLWATDDRSGRQRWQLQ